MHSCHRVANTSAKHATASASLWEGCCYNWLSMTDVSDTSGTTAISRDCLLHIAAAGMAQTDMVCCRSWCHASAAIRRSHKLARDYLQFQQPSRWAFGACSQITYTLKSIDLTLPAALPLESYIFLAAACTCFHKCIALLLLLQLSSLAITNVSQQSCAGHLLKRSMGYQPEWVTRCLGPCMLHWRLANESRVFCATAI